jgi:hypothetical protein
LHLLSASQTSRLSGNGGICVFAGDVDAVYAELAARGARIVKPPQNYDYGMRDFDLIDLDGNQLTFGMGSAAGSAVGFGSKTDMRKMTALGGLC